MIGRIAGLALLDLLVAIGLSAVVIDVSFSDQESWPALAVLVIGVAFFVYGPVRSYFFQPVVAILAVLVALAGIGAFYYTSDAEWRGFAALFIALGASTTVVCSALKAVVDGMLERRFPQQ